MGLKPGDVIRLHNGLYLIVQNIDANQRSYVFFPKNDIPHPPAHLYETRSADGWKELQRLVDKGEGEVLFNMDEMMKRILRGR